MNKVLLAGACALGIAVALAGSADAQQAKKEKKSGSSSTVQYCNQLPEGQCRKCAVERGFPASQYMTYCAKRR